MGTALTETMITIVKIAHVVSIVTLVRIHAFAREEHINPSIVIITILVFVFLVDCFIVIIILVVILAVILLIVVFIIIIFVVINVFSYFIRIRLILIC